MTSKKEQGWAEEDRIYTVIKNVTKNSKLVLSCLNGIEIAPNQTIDLRTMFRRSQVVDAAHEIASLISTGHLMDLAAGDSPAVVPQVGGGAPTALEMATRIQQSKIREISDSSSMSMLQDWMNDKDPKVSAAAKVRSEILLGLRDDAGQMIPGNEEEAEAKPTELIRSPIGGGEPVLSGGASASTAPSAAQVAGASSRAE